MRIAFASLAAVGIMSCRTGSDEVVRIGSEISCRSCAIVIDSVVTLEGASVHAPASLMQRDSTGMYWFGEPGGLLKVYGSDGRFVREIGRIGAGPGEYELLRNVILGNDGSVQILDAALGRRSFFSRDGVFLGSTPVKVNRGIGMPAIELPDGRLLVNVPPASPADAEPLLLIDREGNGKPLNAGGPPVDPRKRWLHHRFLWGRVNGGLLVARPYSFTIDVYDPALSREYSIIREADWVPSEEPNEFPSDGVFDRPPTPSLRSIWEEDELLWLHMVVPSDSWKPGIPEREAAELDMEASSALADRPRFETIIEVVDLECRCVLARSRFEKSVGGSLGGGYLVKSLGETGMLISRIHLQNRMGEPQP